MDMLTPKYGEEKSKKFFDDILHKQDGGVYGVPIPSMQTWLIDEYGKDRDQPPSMKPVEKTMGFKFSMER